MKSVHYAALAVLGAVWGASFLFIGLAAPEFGPLALMFSRVLIAGLILLAVAVASLGPRKIRVNSVNPSMVETEGSHAAGITDGEFRTQIEAVTPLGRIGRPGDIAPAVAFLASDDASWVTGETLYVSGGLR